MRLVVPMDQEKQRLHSCKTVIFAISVQQSLAMVVSL